MEIIQNLIDILNSFWQPVQLFGILLGYLMIGIGLICFIFSDQGKGVGKFGSIMMIIAGLFLVSLDAFIDMASYSLFEQESNLEMFGYSSADANKNMWASAVVLGFAISRFLGLLSALKSGWCFYSYTQNRQMTIFTPIMFLLIAIFGLNLPYVFEVFGGSLGGPIQSSVDKVLNVIK